MISSLSSLADRNFIIGFLLPTAVALAMLQWLFADIVPVANVLYADTKDATALLAAAVLGGWLAAALLLSVSNALHRILEGYWGPLATASVRDAEIAKATAASSAITTASAEEATARQNLAKVRAEFDAGTATAQALQTAKTQRDDAAKAHALKRRDYHARYPMPPDAALPTKFGNVLRAFETYPLTVYGAEGITVWPRLLAVIPDAYQKQIDTARAETDFYVNFVFISAVLAVLATLRFVLAIAPDVAADAWNVEIDGGAVPDAYALRFLAIAALNCAICGSAYRGAIATAMAWGSYVRSAFDLYLPALANALGYEHPRTDAERRLFWYRLVQTFLENRTFDATQWPAARK